VLLRYAVRRLAWVIPIVLGASMVAFTIMHVAPGSPWNREGRQLNPEVVQQLTEDLGLDPFDAFVTLLVREPDIACIGHAMAESDVDTILHDPDVFVASDASATAPDGPGGELPVHPRDYGTFPRALAATRDRGGLSLAAMVRKMTSLPAERFGLHDRGRIAPGLAADIVVFDPEAPFRVTPETLKSQGKNSPFMGYELAGRVRATIVAGKLVYEARSAQ